MGHMHLPGNGNRSPGQTGGGWEHEGLGWGGIEGESNKRDVLMRGTFQGSALTGFSDFLSCIFFKVFPFGFLPL